MPKAVVLVDETTSFKDDRYTARVLVLKVSKSIRFPDGFKVRCVLLDEVNKVPLLLLDNHEPYGYHMHTRLPKDKTHRVLLKVKDHLEAIDVFMEEAKRRSFNEEESNHHY